MNGEPQPGMPDGATDAARMALVDASAAMLEGLAAAQHPLGVVNQSLTDLAEALGVERAVVAIDDAVLGRQVFCSGRRPIGASGAGLWGPPGVTTEPARELDQRLGRLIVAAVGMAFERARSAEPVASADLLLARLAEATARCARYGWGFTLVLAKVDGAREDAVEQLTARLRAGDTVIEAGFGEVGLILPTAAGDDIPQLLARATQGTTIPALCYGLAACPGDATTPSALLLLAKERLREADKARRPREIRTPGRPTV